MKWFKGLFYPDYQSAYIFSPIDFGKIFLSFGRFNYHFGNGWQSYFFIEGGICIGKCRSFSWHFKVKGSNINKAKYELKMALAKYSRLKSELLESLNMN